MSFERERALDKAIEFSRHSQGYVLEDAVEIVQIADVFLAFLEADEYTEVP